MLDSFEEIRKQIRNLRLSIWGMLAKYNGHRPIDIKGRINYYRRKAELCEIEMRLYDGKEKEKLETKARKALEAMRMYES